MLEERGHDSGVMIQPKVLPQKCRQLRSILEWHSQHWGNEFFNPKRIVSQHGIHYRSMQTIWGRPYCTVRRALVWGGTFALFLLGRTSVPSGSASFLSPTIFTRDLPRQAAIFREKVTVFFLRSKTMSTTHSAFMEKGDSCLRKLFITLSYDHLHVALMFLLLIYSRVGEHPYFSLKSWVMALSFFKH